MILFNGPATGFGGTNTHAAAAGDVNGDGFGDFLIASNYDDNSVDRGGHGFVYLIDGTCL